MASAQPRNARALLRALGWSLKGLAAAVRHESSFRLEICLFAIMAPAGLLLGRSGIERALLVAPLLLVLIVELLNSAIEAVVDKTTPERHELAGRAKDMGSAAVLLALVNVAYCWGLVLLPRLWAP